MADNAPAAPATPAPATNADPLDMKTESAGDMLNWSDQEMEQNMGLKRPVEADGEPGPDEILEPTPVEQLTEKPQQGSLKPKAEAKPEVAVAAEEPAVVEPEEPAPEEPAKPITEFQVFDKEGELEVPPDITVTYKADGKLRENVPLDRVVRLAQRGEYNEAREQQVQQSAQRSQDLEQQVQARDQRLQEYDQWFEQILTDDQFRQRALENYQVENTPEAQLQRTREELAQERARQHQQNELQQAAAFVQQQVSPRVSALIEKNPLVPFEEVMGRFNLMIAPYMVRGQVAFQHLPTVKQLVDTDLTHWVEGLSLSREGDRKRVTDTVAAERTKTTLAKRQLVRAQQPAPVTAPAAPKSTENESAEDWLERTLPMPASS